MKLNIVCGLLGLVATKYAKEDELMNFHHLDNFFDNIKKEISEYENRPITVPMAKEMLDKCIDIECYTTYGFEITKQEKKGCTCKCLWQLHDKIQQRNGAGE